MPDKKVLKKFGVTVTFDIVAELNLFSSTAVNKYKMFLADNPGSSVEDFYKHRFVESLSKPEDLKMFASQYEYVVDVDFEPLSNDERIQVHKSFQIHDADIIDFSEASQRILAKRKTEAEEAEEDDGDEELF